MELLLVRHALPLRVERGDGRPADPALSPTGREQAQRLARWLAAGVGSRGAHAVPGGEVHALYTSPLRRARETAAPIGRALGLEARVEPALCEFDAARDHYVPLEELKAEDPEAWRAFVQGGLYDGVDVAAFERDVVASFERIVAAHRGERVLVVCHGGVINVWAAHVLGLASAPFFEPTYTSMSRFFAASSGERSVASLNETGHLHPLAATHPDAAGEAATDAAGDAAAGRSGSA